MLNLRTGWNPTTKVVGAFAMAVLSLAAFTPTAHSLRISEGKLRDRVLRLGERMYRKGLLPSDSAMQSFVAGNIPLVGTTFTCVSCHLRSGTGSYEDGVVTLPTNGASLFHPFFKNLRTLTAAERDNLNLQLAPSRPAYTDETLAIAIRCGTDPTGRKFNPVMPRYDLSERDMKTLVAYLHFLSSDLSPGVDDTTLRFATVITDEVSMEDRQAMLSPLDHYVSFHNQLLRGLKPWMPRSKSGNEMIQEFRQLTLAHWILKGPSKTWPRQLAAYYREDPVFALVGGISYGDWKPIHSFCENHRLPCLFPITDFPVLSETDWYTLYFSKGLYQEGQAAANFAANQVDRSLNKKIIQISLNTPECAALSAGFRDTWRELGRKPVKEIVLEGQGTTTNTVRNAIHRKKPATVLLWAGPHVYGALQDLAESQDVPEMIIMSSSCLQGRIAELPDSARSSTYLTFPFRHPDEEVKYLRNTNTSMAELTALTNGSRIATRTHALIQLLEVGISEMGRNFYRDNLLDRISDLPDQVLPDYERLSFGPGQRYASKGCYIMQLSSGPSPALIKKSRWVIP